MITPPVLTLDRRDRTITTSVVYDAAALLEGMEEGDALEILTKEFEPFTHDIEAWCRAAGHTFVLSEPAGTSAHRFVIQKGPARPTAHSLAMVVSQDGLEELLSPLAFALAAGLEGMQVHVFFQGPAVHVLSKHFKPKLRGWSRPFSRFAAKGMAKSGHAPAHEKISQIRSLGGRIYVCGPSMEHFKVDPAELFLDDVEVIEYLTFMDIMAESDIQLYP